jgi:chitodextrinase
MQIASLTSLNQAEIDAIATALVDSTPPSAPTNLTGTGTSTSAIGLSWGASTDTGTGVKEYLVYRNNTLVKTVTAPLTSVSDTGLTQSTQYSYKVEAVDNSGNKSAQTAAINVTTLTPPPAPDTAAPTVPAQVQAAPTAYNRVTITWAASTDTGGSGIARYIVMSGTTVVATVNAPALSHVHTGRSPSTTYQYAVKAVDGAGNESAASQTVSVTTPAINGAALYGSNCASCHSPLANSTKIGKTAAQITAAISNVAAMKTATLQALPAIEITAIATVLVDSTPPSVPANLAGTGISATAINLSWGASTDAGTGVKEYKVYRNNTLVKTVTAPLTLVSDTGLTQSTQYSYKVEAVDNSGNRSAQTAAINVRTLTPPPAPDTTAPATPAGLTVTVNSYKRITITWTATTDTGGSGLKEYKVFRNNAFWRTIAVPATTTQDNSVAPSASYSYKVSAVDNAGNESPHSAAKAGQTPAINGGALYTHLCESCHGSLANSTKRGLSEALINMALTNIDAMNSITLSSHEVAAIAAALAIPEPPVPERTDQFAYQAPLGTRHYVTSLMRRAFLPNVVADDNAADVAIQNRLNSLILNQVGAMGGPCGHHDGTGQCPGLGTISLEAQMTPAPSVARRGYLTRICQEVLSLHSNGITNALARAGVTAAAPGNATNVAKIYGLFFVGRTPTTAVSNALVNLHAQAIARPLPSTEAWRLVINAVCDAAGVDSL